MAQTWAKHHGEITSAIMLIDSNDPADVISGLNSLLKRSYESIELRQVHLETFPQLIVSIGCLLDTVNPLCPLIFSADSTDIDNGHIFDDQLSAWSNSEVSSAVKSEIQALAYNLDLVGLVLVAVECGSGYYQQSQACALALETLCNIASRIDLTAKSGFEDVPAAVFSTGSGDSDAVDDLGRSSNIYNGAASNSKDFHQSMLQLRLCSHMSSASHGQYLRAVQHLLSAIMLVLSGGTNSISTSGGGSSGSNMRGDGIGASIAADRAVTLRMLEILGKLAQNPDNALVLGHVPVGVPLFPSLVSLLCVSTTRVEPLVPDACRVQGDPLGRCTRPPAAVWLNPQAIPTAAAAVGASSSTSTRSSSGGGGDNNINDNSGDVSKSGAGNSIITFRGLKLHESTTATATGVRMSLTSGTSGAGGAGAGGSNNNSIASGLDTLAPSNIDIGAAGGGDVDSSSSSIVNAVAPFFREGGLGGASSSSSSSSLYPQLQPSSSASAFAAHTSTGASDTELRDASLEAVWQLCAASVLLQRVAVRT
eukprot:CAMPEP_0174993564 /NCGR_PEP_ID=MMETSP0004_2-20121128/23144_1 /TAXON_ID=420556 /ORGANISM="Ochromonas sp., Strain CCMP1393" /LENGTH=535 /DNA_ID=CAMNT_0016247691 /DNA_START=71 /DNA_END=1676 /DNA_ORIENTATION=-